MESSSIFGGSGKYLILKVGGGQNKFDLRQRGTVLNASAVVLTDVVPVTFVGRTLGHGPAGVHGGVGARQAQRNGHVAGPQFHRAHASHEPGVQRQVVRQIGHPRRLVAACNGKDRRRPHKRYRIARISSPYPSPHIKCWAPTI